MSNTPARHYPDTKCCTAFPGLEQSFLDSDDKMTKPVADPAIGS